MPVWHSSVALQSGRGPRSVESLTKKQVAKGVKIATQLLDGVGGDRTVFTTDPVGDAIHVQKPLTPTEIEMLPDGWMSIPAVDERGKYRLLET